MNDASQLRDAARILYATALPDFVITRNGMVRELKKAGDDAMAQRVAAFRKPSVAADLANRFTRDAKAHGDEIADLGARLRAAQAEADAAMLRALDQERRSLLARTVAWARAEAARTGNAASEAVLRDVEQTFWAAMVDARAAATVQAGLLVRPLSPAGFGEVELSGASALDVDLPPEQASAEPSVGEIRAQQKAVEALEEAQAAGRRAQEQLERAVQQVEAAEARRVDLENERDRLRRDLSQVDQSMADARQELTRRRAALKSAETQRRSAAAEVDRALRRCD